jgi:hypothetical protein
MLILIVRDDSGRQPFPVTLMFPPAASVSIITDVAVPN